MAYSAEVLSRARARLAMAKEDRESENREHLQQAYTQVPRLKEIDRLLRATMAQAAQAAFTQGGDPAELLEQARRENLLLQLTSPVRWTQTVMNMISDGADRFIESGPGKVLQGLVAKISDRPVIIEGL